ncbi:MAG: serine/threonine-protein phosphatase [Phycisphaeraceae bacterium]|nr:serine/threonine-protein phosphatase [Phycisphaeraceae bacterium]
MSSAANPRALLGVLLTHAERVFNVQRAIVLTREGLEYPFFRVVFTAERGARPVDGVAGSEFVGQGGLLADLLYAGQFHRMAPILVGAGDPSSALLRDCRSLVAFPMFDHGECSGMVVLLGPSGDECSVHDLCGLAIMGSLLQRADRAEALAQRLEIACRTLNTELAAAASVQRWLLPPSTSSSAAVGVASFYRAAQHCGGDYYDVGPLPDGRIGVLVADVSGHGAAAAVLMAILRTVVHDDVDRFGVGGPAALLDHAHQHLCAIGLPSRGAFITAFAGTLDSDTGRFTYSCAGHPPPRLLRAADRAVMSVAGAGSLPLGILDDSTSYVEETIHLQPGDLLLFYSDGITEARSPSGAFFGTARLDRALLELPVDATPDMVVGVIEDAIRRFAGIGSPGDDQTLLAVRWQPGELQETKARAVSTPVGPRLESEEGS